MHRLDAPAAFDKVASEVIEQFGMAWSRARLTQIIWSGDDSGAKVVLPDAIDHDAGEEGIFRRSDPAGEGGAATGADAAGRAGGNFVLIACRAESDRNAGLHFGARRVVLAAQENVMRGRARV